MVDTNRRRFLQGVGTGSGVGLAGCAALDSGNQESGGNTTDNGEQDTSGGSIPEDGVAVSLALDQAQLRSKQRELQQQLSQGNVTQQAARNQLLELQRTLSSEAAEKFENATDEIEITQRKLEQGILVVEGPSQAMIDALQYDSVSALVSTNRVRQQQQSSQ
jgi:hypothetical protein